jgi:DNA-binding transcriptional regulator YiaG
MTREKHLTNPYNKRNTKIPDDGVREIRKNLYRLSNEQYAEKFNVEIETIEGIVSYKTRKNIK